MFNKKYDDVSIMHEKRCKFMYEKGVSSVNEKIKKKRQ